METKHAITALFCMTMGMGVKIAYAKHTASVRNECAAVTVGYERAIIGNIQKQATLARRENTLLSHLETVANLAKDPHKSLNQQLTVSQIDRYNLLTAQMRYLQAEMFASSEHVRDLHVVERFCQASKKLEKLRNEYIDKNGQIERDYFSWLKRQSKGPYEKMLVEIGLQIPSGYVKQMKEMQDMKRRLNNPQRRQ